MIGYSSLTPATAILFGSALIAGAIVLAPRFAPYQAITAPQGALSSAFRLNVVTGEIIFCEATGRNASGAPAARCYPAANQ